MYSKRGDVYLFHTIAWRIASISTASPPTILLLLLLLRLKNDNISLVHNHSNTLMRDIVQVARR